MKIINLKTADLRPYFNNPRQNAEAVEQVAESIRRYGFKVPIVVDKDRNIVTGHTRLKAAERLGLSEVPCIVADDLTPEQLREFRLVDNQTAGLASWDLQKLVDELEEMPDLSEAFDFESIVSQLGENEPEEADTPDPEGLAESSGATTEDLDTIPAETWEPFVNEGDIWELGDHRLICADSCDPATYERLLGGQLADLVFADPPYGMLKERDGVQNDNLNRKNLLEFNKRWVPLSFKHLNEYGSWYCWGIDMPLMDLYADILRPQIEARKISFRNHITWAKHSAFGVNAAQNMCYPRETEKCLFLVKQVRIGSEKGQIAEEFDELQYGPIFDYLSAEAKKAGLNRKKILELTGTQMYSHWFTKSEFSIPARNRYETLQRQYSSVGAFQVPYDDLLKMRGPARQYKYPETIYFDNTHNEGEADIVTDVWRFAPTTQTEREDTGGHATPKPVALCERGVRMSCPEGGLVLDPFGGSGSTLIACENLGRRAYLAELSPHWCEVIIRRYEKLTGKKAIRAYVGEEK